MDNSFYNYFFLSPNFSGSLIHTHTPSTSTYRWMPSIYDYFFRGFILCRCYCWFLFYIRNTLTYFDLIFILRVSFFSSRFAHHINTILSKWAIYLWKPNEIHKLHKFYIFMSTVSWIVRKENGWNRCLIYSLINLWWIFDVVLFFLSFDDLKKFMVCAFEMPYFYGHKTKHSIPRETKYHRKKKVE